MFDIKIQLKDNIVLAFRVVNQNKVRGGQMLKAPPLIPRTYIFQLSPSNRASLTVFDKGRTLP